MKRTIFIMTLGWMISTIACDSSTPQSSIQEKSEEKPVTIIPDSLDSKPRKKTQMFISADEIRLDTSLLYDKYTLKDDYTYNKIHRDFNWKDIKKQLAKIENLQITKRKWAVMQNYKNRNYEAPLVKTFARNKYGRIADSLGVERYQSVPLYAIADTITPEIYGRDGHVVSIIEETKSYYKIKCVTTDNKIWYAPKRYVTPLADTTTFHHVIVIDRKDQNIATLEWKSRGHWLLRSKNPATTGRNKPPYAQPTPLGMFLIQEQKRKMVYLKDGSKDRGGYAPYASRFTNGAYIHGVPVAAPQTKEIEYSWSLGTIPKSHMCVRNATSHSKFIYQWAPVRQTLVIVLE